MPSPRKRVVLLVDADPRSCGRAVEALRVATGVGAWDRVELVLCLAGEARRLLGPDVDDFIRGEVVRDCLPLLADPPGRLFCLASGTEVPEAGDRLLDSAGFGKLCSTADTVLRF